MGVRASFIALVSASRRTDNPAPWSRRVMLGTRPLSAMLYATEQLRRRLRLSNLDLVEPSGQDGRMCQYLAVIHQLTLHGVLSSFDGHDLEAAMINWLLEHHDVVGYHGERGDMAEVVQLHDTWTELDFHAVRCVGALLGATTTRSPPCSPCWQSTDFSLKRTSTTAVAKSTTA